MSCRKNHLCTKRSCYKECFSNNAGEKLREWYRSSAHKPTQKMHTVKWNRSRACDKVWYESVEDLAERDWKRNTLQWH